MNYNETEKRGRRLLLMLLGLNLAMQIVMRVYQSRMYFMSTLPAAALAGVCVYLLTGLLPGIVVLWAIYRGSWPGLAVLCITVVTGVGDMVGTFQFGGAAAMNSTTLLQLAVLIARGALLVSIFQHYEVNSWWTLCQARRRGKDLVLEIVLFVLALAINIGVGLLL